MAHAQTVTIRPLAYDPLCNTSIYLASAVLAAWSWQTGWWGITVVCWIPLAYFSHALLMAFHEASHGNLGPTRRGNDVRGTILGWFSFVPFSAYRVVHMTHHAHLAEERDEEMWPYCDPSTPRWLRVLAAWGELCCGLIVTPILFARGVYVSRRVSPRQRRKVVRDYLMMLGFWALVLSAVAWFNLWGMFLVVFLVPAFLAGMLQSLRKFTEHLGLLGNTPESAARTIVDDSLVGRFVTATMLNVTYHTAHHRDASLAYHQLPQATATAYAADPEHNPIYPSYWRAFLDMLPSLIDPKVGGQWMAAKPARSAPTQSSAAATG